MKRHDVKRPAMKHRAMKRNAVNRNVMNGQAASNDSARDSPREERRGLRTRAPAKLNLTLEVLRKRDDGYHEIASVLQTVDLADTLTIVPADTVVPAGTVARGDELRIDFQDEEGRPLPVRLEGELVARSWEAVRARFGVEATAAVMVTKRIPIAGGLGGGSADAAAFLRLARAWWALPVDDAELGALAASIGRWDSGLTARVSAACSSR